jgi:hypothetical protein
MDELYLVHVDPSALETSSFLLRSFMLPYSLTVCGNLSHIPLPQLGEMLICYALMAPRSPVTEHVILDQAWLFFSPH